VHEKNLLKSMAPELKLTGDGGGGMGQAAKKKVTLPF